MNHYEDSLNDSFEDEIDDCPVCRMMEEEMGVEHGIPFDELTRRGVPLPHPLQVSDEEISGVLWPVLHALSELRIFLHHTDHLSDAELYELLWRDALRELTWYAPGDPYSATHIDLCGSGSDDDTGIWLKYYANDEERRQWQSQFPDDEMPERVQLSHSRDAMLPDRMDVFEEIPS